MSEDSTPDWAYTEDGYCVCCGNGKWKYHMPECQLRDSLDRAGTLSKILAALDEPVTDAEAEEWNCQCAQDLAAPILGRIEDIVAEATS